MSKQNKIRESVLLPEEYRDKVIAQSEKELRSKSSIIAEAVKLYYERKEVIVVSSNLSDVMHQDLQDRLNKIGKP